MTECEIYTKDGTVGIDKKSVLKKKAGNWKACRFILRTECCESLSFGLDTDERGLELGIQSSNGYNGICAPVFFLHWAFVSATQSWRKFLHTNSSSLVAFVPKSDDNTMDQHLRSKFKNLAVSFFPFDTYNVIFLAPVCDRMIVRLAKRFTSHQGGFTKLQQMGIGLMTSTFAMISVGMLELVQLKTVRRNNYFNMQKIPMTVLTTGALSEV
ncbi:hypothetical protein RJ639_030180 [Escallonia herrerae]|uniref:Uncharacterized protein n=1 Tax=Escallonia herrerae TaxID=1293975 RepID=A0AA88X5T1_9ASTE|nr:hypothetical protein RJ639_030180 [Escallonia herrerae]